MGTKLARPAFSGTLAGTNVAVGTMPVVKGESMTDETPAKAGTWVAAPVSGETVVLDGLRTLCGSVFRCLSTDAPGKVRLTCQ